MLMDLMRFLEMLKVALQSPRLSEAQLQVIRQPLVCLPRCRMLVKLAVHGIPDRAPGLHVQPHAGPPVKPLLTLLHHLLRDQSLVDSVMRRILLSRPLKIWLLLQPRCDMDQFALAHWFLLFSLKGLYTEQTMWRGNGDPSSFSFSQLRT